MLDRRALLLAFTIVAAATAIYVVWVHRTRATMQARSLSASGHLAGASQPVPTTLHVEGCKDDFIVNPGELVEPRATPDATPDQLRAIYGPETIDKDLKSKRSLPRESGVLRWKEYEYSLTDAWFGAEAPGNFLQVSANPRHVLESLDGIELGLDSFGTIFRKMRDKKVEVHERIERGDGGWTLIVSLYSACGRQFRSEYTRTLPDDPLLDRQISPAAAGGGVGSSGLLRSDAFMNKVVSTYTLVPSNGRNDSTAGSPSTHD